MKINYKFQLLQGQHKDNDVCRVLKQYMFTLGRAQA